MAATPPPVALGAAAPDFRLPATDDRTYTFADVAGSTQANKLSRTSAGLIEALNRHRGKGQQKVTVEHVHVHSGGRRSWCVVAAPPGLGRSEESNAKQIRHAPQPALRSEDPQRQAMPIRSDAERPVQDAWRAVPRGSEGE